MCGVVGYVPIDPEPCARSAFGRLFEQSTIRGLHAYGLASSSSRGPRITRAHQATAIIEAFDPLRPSVAHARYSTSGDWHDHKNNQPIQVRSRALVFNGVIHMGTKAEFEAAFDVRCLSENDGEVFLRRLERGDDAVEFARSLAGSFAGLWLDGLRLRALRNHRRPLWRCDAYGCRWYASTADIFRRAGFPTPMSVPVLTLETT